MYLAIDITSKTVKVAAGDLDTGIVALNAKSIPVACSNDGFCRSCDGNQFLEDIFSLVEATVSSPRVDPLKIQAITASSIRPSCVFTDEDLHPLYTGASFDLRGTDVAGELSDRFEELAGRRFWEVSGHDPLLLFPPARYEWFKENDAGTCKKITPSCCMARETWSR